MNPQNIDLVSVIDQTDKEDGTDTQFDWIFRFHSRNQPPVHRIRFDSHYRWCISAS